MFVVDPGHPNKSLSPNSNGFGATYKEDDIYLQEKNLTLETAIYLKNYGIENATRIELTRESDRPVTLQERCYKTRQWQPKSFISLHFNWFPEPEPRGSTIFYKPDEKSEILADSMETYFQGYQSIPHRRTIITDTERNQDLTPYMYVLDNVDSPALLLELAFLSNEDDRKIILKDRKKFVAHYAKVIYFGLKHFEHSGDK